MRNKFFYFLDYEGFRQTLTPTVVDTVPTTNELNGQLAVAVQDPWHPGTYIPAGTPYASWPGQAKADADVTALKIASLYATALPGKCTVAAGLSTTGVATNDCPLNAPFTDHADKGDLRLDYQQSQNSSWFLKVSDRKETGKNFNLLPEPIDMQSNGEILIHDRQVSLGYNHLMGDNKVVDARLALSGTKAGKWTYAIGSSTFPAGSIPGLPTIAGVSGGLPSMAISGGFTSFGRQSTNPQWQNPSVLNPKVNYSWVKGKHSFKFGYEYEYIWMEVEDSNPLYGSFTFNHGYSVCPASAGTTNCPTGTKRRRRHLLGRLSLRRKRPILAVNLLHHTLAPEHGKRVRPGRLEDRSEADPESGTALGVRFALLRAQRQLSNFNSATGTMLTLTPGFAAMSTGVQPVTGYPNIEPGMISAYSGGESTEKPWSIPHWATMLRALASPMRSRPALQFTGGYGTSFIHYWRAGSGNMLGINAPNAMFTSVVNPASTSTVGSSASRMAFPLGWATVSAPAPTTSTTFPRTPKTAMPRVTS